MGKNPFQLDSRKPVWDKYRDYLLSETRYSQLAVVNPDFAEELLSQNLKDAQKRFRMYERYKAMDYSLEENN